MAGLAKRQQNLFAVHALNGFIGLNGLLHGLGQLLDVVLRGTVLLEIQHGREHLLQVGRLDRGDLLVKQQSDVGTARR